MPNTESVTFDFANAEPVRRGRKPAVVLVEIERAIALLAEDGATVPLAWRRGRSRRTYQLGDRRVVLWVRKDAPKGWRPPSAWRPAHVSEPIYIPAE